MTPTVYTIGVDPGITGAIALLKDGRFDSIYDMPTEVKKSGRNQIDVTGLLSVAREIRLCAKRASGSFILVAVLELNSATPAKATTSMMSMGDSYGCARMFLAVLGASVRIVTPNEWKQKMRLNKDKEYSRAQARKLYPEACDLLDRKKDHNRAESLLLARFLLDFA